MKIETYTLTASNGRKIRQATRVIMDNGHVVNFMEKMTKREALRQAPQIMLAELCGRRDALIQSYTELQNTDPNYTGLDVIGSALNALHDEIADLERAEDYVSTEAKGDWNDGISRWHY